MNSFISFISFIPFYLFVYSKQISKITIQISKKNLNKEYYIYII